MIGFEEIFVEFRELRRDELERWIANAWIRPEGAAGRYRFHEIDLARIRLILDLRETMEVNEAALPTVLSLLDQIYEMRRRMHRLNEVLAHHVPAEVTTKLLDEMS